jgi:hypothetical protein
MTQWVSSSWAATVAVALATVGGSAAAQGAPPEREKAWARAQVAVRLPAE